MGASRFNPRFSLIATWAISFALLLHFVCFLLIYLRKDHWGQFDSVQWEPVSSTLFLIFIPPPLLLVAAIIVSGRYRLAFHAVLSLFIASCLVFVWTVTFQKRIYVNAAHATREGADWCTYWMPITIARGGIQIEFKQARNRNDNPPILLKFNAQAPSQGTSVYPFRDALIDRQWLPAFFRDWGIEAASCQLPGNSQFSLTFPIWFLLIPCAIFPSWWLYRRFRPKLYNKPGHCRQCGYDLRGNTSEKCPECGTPIPPRKEIAKAANAVKPA